MRIYIYIYIHIHVYIRICIYIYIYIHTYTYTYTYKYISKCAFMILRVIFILFALLMSFADLALKERCRTKFTSRVCRRP